MKKVTTLGIAVLAMLALAAVAMAQTAPLTVTGKGSPTKAGTKKKPANTKTTVAFQVDPSINATLDTITYTFPKTIKVSGKGCPTCSLETIVDKGESTCPSKSKVGSGTASAALGTSPLAFTYNIYVGGDKSITLALKGAITTNFSGKISGSKVIVKIPETVQIPVKGPTPETSNYSYVRAITANLGAKSVTKGKGKKKKTYSFVSSTGCKSKKQTVKVDLATTPNGQPAPSAPLSGSVDIPCK